MIKRGIVILSGVGLLLFVWVGLPGAAQDEFPVLKGPYLGQEPPGMTPEVFAPGVISTSMSEGCSGFTNEGSFFIFRRSFSRTSDAVYQTELVDGIWTKPVMAAFKSKFYDGDFTFGPDDQTLYFTSTRSPRSLDESRGDSNIWMVKKGARAWSDPHMFAPPINSEHHDSYPSAAADQTLYFFCRDRGGYGQSDIFLSRFVNRKYGELENLGDVINTEHHEWDPFIAPDESYLIFCSTKPEGFGEDDLYIAFKKGDGTWGRPVNLGEEFNSSESENRPYVTNDGKYFFFTSNKSGNRDIYWADAKALLRLSSRGAQ